MGKQPTVRESDIQIAIVDLLSLLSRQHNFIFFSVPNESAMKAKKKDKSIYALINLLKKMGLTPGASDLVIGKAGRAYFLEVKRPREKQTRNQSIFEAWVTAAGFEYEITTSPDETLSYLKTWGIIS